MRDPDLGRVIGELKGQLGIEFHGSEAKAGEIHDRITMRRASLQVSHDDEA